MTDKYSMAHTLSNEESITAEKGKFDMHMEEVEIARFTESDVFQMSKDALTLRSWTGVRLCLIMFVMGCNQAGTYFIPSPLTAFVILCSTQSRLWC